MSHIPPTLSRPECPSHAQHATPARTARIRKSRAPPGDPASGGGPTRAGGDARRRLPGPLAREVCAQAAAASAPHTRGPGAGVGCRGASHTRGPCAGGGSQSPGRARGGFASSLISRLRARRRRRPDTSSVPSPLRHLDCQRLVSCMHNRLHMFFIFLEDRKIEQYSSCV